MINEIEILMIRKRTWMVIAIVVGAVLIDQVIKLYVATHFALGESVELTSWFHICYIENNPFVNGGRGAKYRRLAVQRFAAWNGVRG